MCYYCNGKLSDPKRITPSAKLLTLQGLIQGIVIFYLFSEYLVCTVQMCIRIIFESIVILYYFRCFSVYQVLYRMSNALSISRVPGWHP